MHNKLCTKQKKPHIIKSCKQDAKLMREDKDEK